MLMIDYRAPSWWYWLATVSCLTAGVAGRTEGFVLAIAITVVNLAHFAWRERRLAAFPVQVRIAYLLLLLLALPQPMQPIYWIPTIGTWAQVLFGYCAMARTLSLLPWNRSLPFTRQLIARTFFSAPVRGNILQGLPPL